VGTEGVFVTVAGVFPKIETGSPEVFGGGVVNFPAVVDVTVDDGRR